MDRLPISIPVLKPVQIRTRRAWVRVLTDTGMDDLKNTHGLPVSNTTSLLQFSAPVSTCQSLHPYFHKFYNFYYNERKLKWHTHTREAPPPPYDSRSSGSSTVMVTARRHSRLPMRHREPWQGLVHAAQCGGLHPQVLIVLSTPTTTSEQAAQMTPALFGLASGSMFINTLFHQENICFT